MKRLLASTLLSAFAAAAQAASVPPQPVAPVHVVIDHYGSTTVTDPYRWMEAEPEPQFRAYLHAQDDHARALLARISGRSALLRDVSALSGLAARAYDASLVGDRYFYLKRPAGAELARLYVRDAGSGRERLLVDPATLGTAVSHAAIDQYAASPDGALVAYGVSQGGSEQSVLHVIETATGRVLPDSIDRAQFAAVSWAEDGKSFFYSRTAKLPASAPASEGYSHIRVLLHLLGRDPDTDHVVLDVDHLPFAFAAPQVFPSLQITPGSDYALALISDGVSPEIALYAAPVQSLDSPHPAWRSVAVQHDGITGATVHGATISLLSHDGAPRFKIMREDLAHPGYASATTVVPQGSGVITGLAAASDGLYYAQREGAVFTLHRLAAGASASLPIPLPFAGTIEPPLEDAGGLVADPRTAGVLLSLASWLHPEVWLRYTPGAGGAAGSLVDTRIAPAFPRDLSGYEAVEATAPARDGTPIPISILKKKGVALDGHRPTLVDGYGSYGISLDPEFSADRLPWLDRGGVFVETHVRGGGEGGLDWHLAGKIETKEHTITDFIDCSDWLIAHRYTDHAHIAGEGTSAGGILIGGAITQDPSLFRAALIRVGSSNASRAEFTENGPSNIPEFGTVTNPEQLPWLLAMDAYQHVKAGTPYPAVLLTGGADDPRVSVWEPAKMAARLQAATSSGRPVLLRIEFDAGHGLGSTRTQRDVETADEDAFLLWQFGEPGYQPGR